MEELFFLRIPTDEGNMECAKSKSKSKSKKTLTAGLEPAASRHQDRSLMRYHCNIFVSKWVLERVGQN